MKSIEEIEKISLDALEAVSESLEVETPEVLGDKVDAALTAASLKTEGGKARRTAAWTVPAFSAVLAGLVVVFALGRAPKEPADTFSDPQMAYAEVERTLEYISSKMDKRRAAIERTEELMARPLEIMENIRNK